MALDSHSQRSPEDLIADIARNREKLAVHRENLRHSMDVRGRMQQSFHENSGMFLGTAAVLGVLLALIPSSRRSKELKLAARRATVQDDRRRKSESNSKKSFAAVLLGLAGKAAIDFGKPVVLKMVREHFLAAQQRPGPGAQTQTRRAS